MGELVRVASGELRGNEIQDLADSVGELSKAAAGHNLRFLLRLELGGEKREITVVMSDIRSFTTLSEGMDPTALVSFLNEYFTLQVEAIKSLPAGTQVALTRQPDGSWTGVLAADGREVQAAGPAEAGPQAVLILLARLWAAEAGAGREGGEP